MIQLYMFCTVTVISSQKPATVGLLSIYIDRSQHIKSCQIIAGLIQLLRFIYERD